MSPVIDAWIVADVSGFVDARGELTQAGCLAAWHVLSDAPSGTQVRLRLGSARWVYESYARQYLGDLSRFRRVEIECAYAGPVCTLMAVLREDVAA